MVKPSREVYPLDEIELRKDQINYKLKINDLPESRLGAKLVDIYRTDVTPKESFEALELLKYSKDYYRKRHWPANQKDRRDIEDYKDEDDAEL